MTRRFSEVCAFAVVGLLALSSLNAIGADADSQGVDSTSTDKGNGELLTRTSLFENKIAYLRVSNVDAGLDEAIGSAWPKFSSSTNLIGMVLDLRYAEGSSAAAAQATASLLEKKNLPLTILVNGSTGGEAASLAARLRKANDGLVFGSQPGDSSPASAVVLPDITVSVSPAAERAYYADAFRAFSTTIQQGGNGSDVTNGSAQGGSTQRVPTTEAELVRQRLKDRGEPTLDLPVRSAEPQAPLVRDPVLARALDLLKGLAIVHEAKL